MKHNGLIMLIIMLGSVIACKHTPVIPNEPAISFSKQVLPIIVSNCAQSGCHDGKRRFALNTYQQISTWVQAGDASNSRIYTSITDRSMPPSNPLSDEQAKLIYIWIMQGANNN